MNGERSSQGVREIPITRAYVGDPSGAAASGLGASPLPHHGSHTTAWSTTRYDPVTNAPQQEEYYRREVGEARREDGDYRVDRTTRLSRLQVMTRTLVTRSTEALSQPAPPLSRSSPIEMLPPPRPMPMPSGGEPRDEITEEVCSLQPTHKMCVAAFSAQNQIHSKCRERRAYNPRIAGL